jgi:hypothetical protein
MELEVLKQRIDILQVFVKPRFDWWWSFAEIYEDIGLVFVASKFLGDVAFPNAASAFDKQGGATVFLSFPLD